MPARGPYVLTAGQINDPAKQSQFPITRGLPSFARVREVGRPGPFMRNKANWQMPPAAPNKANPKPSKGAGNLL